MNLCSLKLTMMPYDLLVHNVLIELFELVLFEMLCFRGFQFVLFETLRSTTLSIWQPESDVIFAWLMKLKVLKMY